MQIIFYKKELLINFLSHYWKTVLHIIKNGKYPYAN